MAPRRSATRAAGKKLEEWLGQPLPKRVGPADAESVQEAYVGFQRLSILYQLYRWTVLAGRLPTADDWRDPDSGWPTVEDVDYFFESWDKLLEDSGIGESKWVDGQVRLTAAAEAAQAEDSELERRERAAEEAERKLPELRRQADAARAKREEADERAKGLARDVERLGAALAAAEAARDEALAARPEPAAPEPPPPPPEPDAALAEEEAAHARTRAALDAAEDERSRLADELQQARRIAAGLASELARAGSADDDAARPAEDEEPRSVLDAVRIAARRATHLRFADRAFESAADSPFTRPVEILDALLAIDELAGLYDRPEGFGTSVGDAARTRGLAWKPGVSEITTSRYPDHYHVPYGDHRLRLGPHVAIGTGSGANFIARIYLYMGDVDGEDRRMVVGHVGRHLPDTTT